MNPEETSLEQLIPGLTAGDAGAYALLAVLILRLYQAAEIQLRVPRWARWRRLSKIGQLGVVAIVGILFAFLGSWLVKGMAVGAAIGVALVEGWKVVAAMVAGHEATSAFGELSGPLTQRSIYKVSLSRPMSLAFPAPSADRAARPQRERPFE